MNYELVREFEHQPPLPAPFSTLSVTYVLLRMFFAWCSRRKYIRHDFAYMACVPIAPLSCPSPILDRPLYTIHHLYIVFVIVYSSKSFDTYQCF